MSAITLDAATAAALTAATGRVDALDPAGNPVGVFLPPGLAAEAAELLAYRRRVLDWGKAQTTNDELRQISEAGGFRPMEDLLKLAEGA